MVRSIYHNLGLEQEVLSAEEAHQPAVSRFHLHTKAVSGLGIAMMEVISYGPGIEQAVKGKLRDLCHEGIGVVYLRLPLGEPQTAARCERFEDLGFFFSGIQVRPPDWYEPDGLASEDVLCLQYLNGPRLDYDLLQIHSDFGKELVAYVRERDPLA